MGTIDWNLWWVQLIITTLFSILGTGGLVGYRFNKKLKTLDHKHEEEMNKLKAKLESDTFISNRQYEKEFEICQELWGYQIDCYSYYVDFVNEFIYILGTINLGEDVDKIKVKQLLDEITKVVNNFEKQSSKYEPFYCEDIYKAIRKISDLAVNLMCDLENFKVEADVGNFSKIQYHGMQVEKHYGEMMEAKANAAKEIRKYLDSLKVLGNTSLSDQ